MFSSRSRLRVSPKACCFAFAVVEDVSPSRALQESFERFHPMEVPDPDVAGCLSALRPRERSQSVSRERLGAVADEVRGWLFQFHAVRGHGDFHQHAADHGGQEKYEGAFEQGQHIFLLDFAEIVRAPSAHLFSGESCEAFVAASPAAPSRWSRSITAETSASRQAASTCLAAQPVRSPGHTSGDHRVPSAKEASDNSC